MFKRKRSSKGYWFTIQSPNGQTLATSETYTTAAMRDKGIEAVKKVVWKNSTAEEVKQWWGEKAWNVAARIDAERKAERARTIKTQGTGWKVSEVKRDRGFAKKKDTFNIENKKGKIVKR